MESEFTGKQYEVQAVRPTHVAELIQDDDGPIRIEGNSYRIGPPTDEFQEGAAFTILRPFHIPLTLDALDYGYLVSLGDRLFWLSSFAVGFERVYEWGGAWSYIIRRRGEVFRIIVQISGEIDSFEETEEDSEVILRLDILNRANHPGGFIGSLKYLKREETAETLQLRIQALEETIMSGLDIQALEVLLKIDLQTLFEILHHLGRLTQ